MPKNIRFAIGAGLIVAAITYLIVTAVRNTAEYYLTVNEIRARETELSGQMLRVAGRVQPASIGWDVADTPNQTTSTSGSHGFTSRVATTVVAELAINMLAPSSASRLRPARGCHTSTPCRKTT